MQARQRPHHVVGAEIAVARDIDGRQPAFRNLHLHRCVGELLLGQAHRHGHIAAFLIGLLKLPDHGLDSFETYIRAKTAVYVGKHRSHGCGRKGGVASD